jgi:hypothetical protein
VAAIRRLRTAGTWKTFCLPEDRPAMAYSSLQITRFGAPLSSSQDRPRFRAALSDGSASPDAAPAREDPAAVRKTGAAGRGR